MFYIVTTLLFYSALTAFCVWHGVSLLDYCMQYPNPFWKIRFWAANRATDKRFTLKKWLVMARASPIEDQGAIMEQHYNEIASSNPSFKRWICPYCLSTFVAIFVAGVVVFILSGIYGWWAAMYWVTVFPFIGFLGSK